MQVMAVRQLRTIDGAGLAGTRSQDGRSRDLLGRKFALAYGDTARQRSLIVVDAIVGDFQVMRPRVYEDATTSLGTVGDGQAVDARRVAYEIARVQIVRAMGTRAGDVQQEGGAVQEGSFRVREWIQSVMVDSSRQHRDSRSFICSHQRRLLQLFRQVAV